MKKKLHNLDSLLRLGLGHRNDDSSTEYVLHWFTIFLAILLAYAFVMFLLNMIFFAEKPDQIISNDQEPSEVNSVISHNIIISLV